MKMNSVGFKKRSANRSSISGRAALQTLFATGLALIGVFLLVPQQVRANHSTFDDVCSFTVQGSTNQISCENVQGFAVVGAHDQFSFEFSQKNTGNGAGCGTMPRAAGPCGPGPIGQGGNE